VLVDREEGDRMIVLVTDGYSADLGGGREEEIARRLLADRIVVYAVHIAEPPVPDEIVKITAMTGGEVFAPGDKEGLKHVFEHIDKMHQTRLEKTRSEPIDDYPPWCVAGLAVLGTWLLTRFGLRFTPW
jgi:Ca-activated chloride channel family protein